MAPLRTQMRVRRKKSQASLITLSEYMRHSSSVKDASHVTRLHTGRPDANASTFCEDKVGQGGSLILTLGILDIALPFGHFQEP